MPRFAHACLLLAPMLLAGCGAGSDSGDDRDRRGNSSARDRERFEEVLDFVRRQAADDGGEVELAVLTEGEDSRGREGLYVCGRIREPGESRLFVAPVPRGDAPFEVVATADVPEPTNATYRNGCGTPVRDRDGDEIRYDGREPRDADRDRDAEP